MTRMRMELPAVIALGSNLGDREATLRAAVGAIDRLSQVAVTGASALVETFAVKPDGVDETAPEYLNAVVAVRTTLEPEALLAALLGIEQEFGRVRVERWGDRTLDLDLISMGGMTRGSDVLELPHPRAVDRPFVLVPWKHVEPLAVLPGAGLVASLPNAADALVRVLEGAPLWPIAGIAS